MTAPHVLLLHGALGASIQFLPLEARLGDRFRVHTLDFEGHGSSPVRTRPFRIGHFAENVVELLDRKRLAQVHLFGYSMGGYVALHLAAIAPGRVRRVATLATKLAWTPDVAVRESAMLDCSTIREKLPKFATALEQRHTALGWEALLGRTAELLAELGARPVITSDVLTNIEQLVRIAVGDRDATVSIGECADAVRALRNGQLEVHPATPHPFEKAPIVRIARSLTEFFA